MFLLWSTDADPDSINVPIGYVTWKVAGTADQNTKNRPPWSLAGKQTATTATYSASTDTRCAWSRAAGLDDNLLQHAHHQWRERFDQGRNETIPGGGR